ncbi:MAG: hypothetical protein PHH28_03520 [Desulfuromonadaceae bacterium]|nr:hypothetical protein [Desulfuromonadaceae bacterium]
MIVKSCLFSFLILSLTACAGTHAVGDKNPSTEYVEVSNPAFTMSRDAPDTIWVPKSSVDNGPPRAKEAIKMAYKSVQGNQADSGAPPQTSSSLPVASPTVANTTSSLSADMRNRVVVLGTGSDLLTIPFREKLRVLPHSPVLAIAPDIAANKIQSRDERAAYAVKNWQDSGAPLSLFVSAPDGLAAGRYLAAEIYDGMGAGLLSRVEAIIPPYDAKDPASQNTALDSAMTLLAERARDAIALLPWYAKIVAVEGDRIYINAGHEAGINIGQKLKVYRGGRVMQGLGFSPEAVVGTVEVTGFVGANGATALIKGGGPVYLTDIITGQ